MTGHTQRMHAPGRLCGWLGALRAMFTTISFGGDPNHGPALVALPTAWATAPSFSTPEPRKPTCTVTLAQAVKAVVAAKAQAGFRPRYVVSLRQGLAQLIKGFEADPITGVTLEWLERRIGEVGGSAPASKASYIGRTSALFSFAVRRGWITENPCRRLEKPRIAHTPPAVITAAQTRQMMDLAPVEIRAYLALCVFLGLRPSEAEAMTWQNIRLSARKCVVDAAACKTGRRRVVPISENAAEWLALDAKTEGPVITSHSTMRRRRRELCERMGWALTQDCLRHTYCSMSVAAGVNIHELADRMGNSRAIIGRNYKELVAQEEATAFWQIRPTA